jgi:DNA-binding FadR family transcriptional regulator
VTNGSLASGQRLPNETALGLELGVSRSVIREAVRVLASKGLVSARPKLGTRAQPRENWNVLDPEVLTWILEADDSLALLGHLVELRNIIEPQAARLAAARATPRDVSRLEHWYSRMVDSSAGSDERIAADVELHNAIVAASDNEFLAQLGVTLGGVMRASQRVSSRAPGDELPLHFDVVEGIRSGDGDRAEEAMRRLLQSVAVDFEQVLTNRHRETAAGKRAGRGA